MSLAKSGHKIQVCLTLLLLRALGIYSHLNAHSDSSVTVTRTNWSRGPQNLWLPCFPEFFAPLKSTSRGCQFPIWFREGETRHPACDSKATCPALPVGRRRHLQPRSPSCSEEWPSQLPTAAEGCCFCPKDGKNPTGKPLCSLDLASLLLCPGQALQTPSKESQLQM